MEGPKWISSKPAVVPAWKGRKALFPTPILGKWLVNSSPRMYVYQQDREKLDEISVPEDNFLFTFLSRNSDFQPRTGP